MAEIRVERKQGPNVWPWIIGLLVAAAVVWYFVSRRDRAVQTGAIAPAAAENVLAQAPAASAPHLTLVA